MNRALTLLLFLAAAAIQADETREERYFREQCLPLARAFLKTNHIAYDSEFPTNRIRNWKVNFTSESGVYSSQMALDGRVNFMFQGREGAANLLQYFIDSRAWRDVWLEPEHVEKLRSISAQRNCLTTNTALALARRCLMSQGYRETDFHPVIGEQVIWAGAIPQKRIVLPVYQFNWISRKVALPPKPGQTPPSVRMTVSGISSNVVEYTTFMPLPRK